MLQKVSVSNKQKLEETYSLTCHTIVCVEGLGKSLRSDPLEFPRTINSYGVRVEDCD